MVISGWGAGCFVTLRWHVRGPAAQRLLGTISAGEGPAEAVFGFTDRPGALDTLGLGFEETGRRRATCWQLLQLSGVAFPRQPRPSALAGGVGEGGCGAEQGTQDLLCGLGLTAVTPKGWGFFFFFFF